MPTGAAIAAPNPQGGSKMHRRSERKAKSARRFNKGAKKTHRKNISIMRGGWRL